MQRVTLQQLAERAGVSPATASHAMSGSGRVAPTTRERVRQAARELDYRPDPMLSALVGHRRDRQVLKAPANLAFLVYPRNEGEWGPGKVAWSIWEAARETAREMGYALEIMNLNEHPRLGTAARILRDRGVRGVIFPFHRQRADLGEFPLEEFAVVEVGYINVSHREIDRVTMNDFAAMRRVWSEMIARGYRRIGFAITESTDANSGEAWSAAYRLEQAQAAAKQGLEPLPIYDLNQYSPNAAELFGDWMKMTRPDAIISRKNLRGFFTELNLRVPEDLGYAGLGVHDNSATSGTVFDAREIGRNTVAMLDHSLRHDRLGAPECPRTVLLQPRWNEGSTLRSRL